MESIKYCPRMLRERNLSRRLNGTKTVGYVSLRYTILAKHYQPIMRVLYFSGDIVTIQKSVKESHSKLIEIWEASVRATHNFLPEKNILELKPLILEQYFDLLIYTALIWIMVNCQAL